MKLVHQLTTFSMRRPTLVIWAVVFMVLGASVGFTRIKVDTDPENMLPADDPVRVRNAELEEVFGSGPMIVVGLFGEVETVGGLTALANVHDALVERTDVVGESTVSVRSVLRTLPQTQADVDAMVAAIESDQLLAGNVLFADEPGAALFVGLVDKSVALDVANAAEDLIANEPELAKIDVEVGGLPLAEDAFGREMFIQMAIFAPLAGLLVFALMWLFFRRLLLVVPAMLLAMATVIMTMGALVGTGNSLHIMSSMIPIFLMPIALLDSVHVLSDFFDRYEGGPREPLVTKVMDELGRPLGYTTLTTAVGFGSLALVPIPPVRVFGIFVAMGVALAWLLTVTFLPAFMVAVAEHRLVAGKPVKTSGTWLEKLEALAVRRRVWVLAGAALVVAATAPGLAAIEVNDNPVNWFRSDHEIRQATNRLGSALPGTFTTSIVLKESTEGGLASPETRDAVAELVAALQVTDEVGAVQSYVAGDHPMLLADGQANIRMQLRSGDNSAMQEVVAVAEAHLASSPIPNVSYEWAGEAYLNLTWQEDMVSGMLVGFAMTLGVIFLLLVLLFRSFKWAVLGILPVLGTIVVVYGAMAYAGRDMDMPLAVLSTMVLGIGVDFAIHFVERFRELRSTTGSTQAALVEFYGEPATAMTRNAVVIAVGFSPLLFSSLVPYIVVGALLASIVTLSWFASILVLPAAVSYMKN